MMNPIFKGTEHININIISGTNTLAGGIISINYLASPLTGCSYTSSNDTTGINSTRTFSFLPSVLAIAGSNLVVTLPTWINDFSSNSLAFGAGAGASFTCVGISVHFA